MLSKIANLKLKEIIFFSGKYNHLILFAFVLGSSNGNVRENNI